MEGLKQAQPLYKQAYETLKKQIISGEIASGTRLVTTQLTEKFQVSRTPLREALRQLENEGLLTQDKMGATVIELDRRDFEELCECRLVLEKQVVTVIINQIADGQLAEIEALLNQVEAYFDKGDHLKILELNAKFHGLFLEACPNKRLVQLLHQVRSMLLLYRANIVRGVSHNGKILEEHRAIFEAIKRRNLEDALTSIEEHLLNDKQRGISVLEES